MTTEPPRLSLVEAGWPTPGSLGCQVIDQLADALRAELPEHLHPAVTLLARHAQGAIRLREELAELVGGSAARAVLEMDHYREDALR